MGRQNKLRGENKQIGCRRGHVDVCAFTGKHGELAESLSSPARFPYQLPLPLRPDCPASGGSNLINRTGRSFLPFRKSWNSLPARKLLFADLRFITLTLLFDGKETRITVELNRDGGASEYAENVHASYIRFGKST